MSIKAVLFDLDGTLLPMDQDTFVKAYIGGLGKVSATHGYSPEEMMNAIMVGTAQMVKNSGEETNETVFWKSLSKIFGESILNDTGIYDEFYKTDFQKIKNVCGFSPLARDVIDCVKAKGFRAVLATNPLFPRVATDSRIRWAGLEASDFELITTYEGSHCCKPNPNYYKEILSKINLSADECLMVGNDVAEDMIAAKLGMKVFLLTDCLINKTGEDITAFAHGSFPELIDFINSLN